VTRPRQHRWCYKTFIHLAEELEVQQPANPLNRQPYTLLRAVIAALREQQVQPVDSSDTSVNQTFGQHRRVSNKVSVQSETQSFLLKCGTISDYPTTYLPTRRRPDPSANILLTTLCRDGVIVKLEPQPAAPVFARFKVRPG